MSYSRSEAVQRCRKVRTQDSCDVIRIGNGRSVAQHGELFQGQIEDGQLRKRRCLVSLPCSCLYSTATFRPLLDDTLHVDPPYKQKARRVVDLALRHFDADIRGGHLVIQSNIPEAKGYGSSTADCVAAVIATADALARYLTEEEIAMLVVRAELASDNFMFSRAVLFAHREGVVLEDYASTIPALEVLGIDADLGGLVDTLEFPPAVYTWRQIQQFRTLTGALRRAIRSKDLGLLGRVATASAVINQEFLPKPMFKEIGRLAERAGALGIAVAHSGTVMGVLMDPADPEIPRRIEFLQVGLQELGVTRILRFQTNGARQK
jgi:uncharacterized protein involved in propanediol utilization